MTQPKERPILFSAPMVRAILEGRKTVTRRPVKVQPFDLSWSRRDHKFEYTAGRAKDGDEIDGFYAYSTRSGGQWSAKCPYGQPGDRLWVREAHFINDYRGVKVPEAERADTEIVYRADPAPCWEGEESEIRWRPSIHMPRWTSRILLEITALRIERLQAGEGETAHDSRYLVEGINRIHHGDGQHYYHAFKSEPGLGSWVDPFEAWRELWVEVSGAESWNANPWVWVVEFKRVTP